MNLLERKIGASLLKTQQGTVRRQRRTCTSKLGFLQYLPYVLMEAAKVFRLSRGIL
jgi:hypothetical protein